MKNIAKVAQKEEEKKKSVGRTNSQPSSPTLITENKDLWGKERDKEDKGQGLDGSMHQPH